MWERPLCRDRCRDAKVPPTFRARLRLRTKYPSIAQLKDRARHFRLAPLHRRRRNKLLGISRQLLEKRVSPLRIEFAENIVEQKQWRRSFFKPKNPRLRDFQGERHRP